MGFFSNILQKLGLGDDTAVVAAPAGEAVASDAPATGPATPAPVALVDVVAQLAQRAAANPQTLNWRTSIVDLLKLLDIDSSLAARKALAAELDCPTALMADSAQMNIWLHKRCWQALQPTAATCPRICWTEFPTRPPLSDGWISGVGVGHRGRLTARDVAQSRDGT